MFRVAILRKPAPCRALMTLSIHLCRDVLASRTPGASTTVQTRLAACQPVLAVSLMMGSGQHATTGRMHVATSAVAQSIMDCIDGLASSAKHESNLSGRKWC